MYKKTIITFLIFLVSFAFIELHPKSKSSKLNIEKLDMNEKNNLQLMDHLFGTNRSNSFKIKNYWEEGDLASQKNIAYLPNKFSITSNK